MVMRREPNLFVGVLACILILASAPGTTFAQSSACISFGHDLALGSTGSDVTKLQIFLKGQGFFTARMMPRYGLATQAAVRSFQRDKGISTTGRVGPLTRAAIKNTSCGDVTGAETTSNPISSGSSAANNFEVTGWIPYWRSATGTRDVLPHLDLLTEVNPFVYSVKTDGTIVDNGKLSEEPWLSFIAAAKEKHVRVVPTIMWSNPDAMHAILSSGPLRQGFEDQIASLVISNGFDGIDIDFEGKHAEDKNYYSKLLKGLSLRLGNKWLMCTIESRTPIDSRYYGADVPLDAGIYANDLKEINKYCDRVRIMTYDQQGIDLELSARAASSSQVYAPVGDPFWVRKVVEYMSKDIKKSKLLIGVPTYGYEYDVTAYADHQYTYDILWTFNPGYAWPIASQYGITPVRNMAGELQFTYMPSGNALPAAPVSLNNIPGALLAAAASSAYADSINSHQTFRLIDWPDAQSIAGKAELAADLGIRGISIFKFDGGEDQNMWNILVGVKQ